MDGTLMAWLNGVILSHTKMSGVYFCSTVAVKDTSGWRVWRPIPAPLRHLRYDQIPGNPIDEWSVFRWVAFHFIGVPTLDDARPTHPEDLVIDTSSVRFGANAMDFIVNQVVRQFTYNSIDDIFPEGVVAGKYVTEQRLMRSNGYVFVRSLQLEGERIQFTLGSKYYDIRIKCRFLLERIRAGVVQEGVYENVFVRVGLAAPWAGKYGWNPMRCYLMANYVGI
ncbi:hypothetical protein KJ766_03095 [Patescibacteria group bacterium]|nr:hypothetical protein [Patescibacteria group bacterium]